MENQPLANESALHECSAYASRYMWSDRRHHALSSRPILLPDAIERCAVWSFKSSEVMVGARSNDLLIGEIAAIEISLL